MSLVNHDTIVKIESLKFEIMRYDFVQEIKRRCEERNLESLTVAQMKDIMLLAKYVRRQSHADAYRKVTGDTDIDTLTANLNLTRAFLTLCCLDYKSNNLKAL